jgi:flagellar hook-associated protein 1
MGLSQALSSALSGVNTTQQSLSVIAGNVANANTPGYIEETTNQVEVSTTGQPGTSVEVTGVNRELNTLLQNQLWTETSGSSYADTSSQIYQQLQGIYGTPGSSTSFDAIYNNFTSAMQSLATNPSSASQQSAVVSAAQELAQNLNSMTTSIQELRTQAESGIANDVQTANGLLQQIAQINGELQSTQANTSAGAQLQDQRGEDITQLSQLMNVNVVQNPDNQISVFTSTGQQLVGGPQASQLSFADAGTLSATSLWSSDPSQDGVGTITLTAPGGTTTDLLATGAIQSGEIAAYVNMRDNVLPQAQNQLDELANQMSQALSNQTTSGTAVTPSGSQAGYNIDTGSLLAGNTIQLTYTDSGGTQHTVNIVSLGQGGSLPLQTSPSNPNSQTIGVNFSAGMTSVVAQLNAAFGTNLQFSNPTGSTLQVLNASGSGNVVNSTSATVTATSLTSGSAQSPQLPLFTDLNGVPITGALSSAGSQTTGLAGRIEVNPALAASPSNLVAYSSSTTAGDPTRPDFILNQLTAASLTYSPDTGIGTAQAPYSGTLSDYMSQIVSQQSQAANAATNLQQSQQTVLSALQQSFNSQSGVNIDTEMSNLIALQNAYAANARVMTTVQQLMSTLLQVGT